MAINANSLPFLVAPPEEIDNQTKGIFRPGDGDAVLKAIPIEALRTSLHETTTALRSLFDEIAAQSGRMKLRQVHIGFEVTATGGIQLIGTSQVGSKGAITLVFGEEA
ncbi:Pepco domain-containing protein [Actinoallomurus sp. CA-142502]|uniref:Pepco domain-containing protein n=1 Tax=Actinoallomurus sp. CA-142502 TaxID=3239885 RepID=UPI003D93A058